MNVSIYYFSLVFAAENKSSMDRKSKLLDMLVKKPADNFLLFAVAKEYEAEHNYKQAMHYYTTIYENDPTYAGLYYHMVLCMIRLDSEEAKILEMFEIGLSQITAQGDNHALHELQNLKMNYEIGELDLD